MQISSVNFRNRNSKVHAIFIDWNGTLSPTKFWSQLEKSEKQEDRNLFELWANTLFKNFKDKIVPWMKGLHTSEEMIDLIAKETKTDPNNIEREFIIGCEKMEYSSPNIPKLIQSLRNKSVLIAIASNNMDCFTRWTVPHLNLKSTFDEILNSYDLQALKHELDQNKQSLFFKNFFNKYSDIDPTKCEFIDDGEDKMNTITNLGIKYTRINTGYTLEHKLQNILANL